MTYSLGLGANAALQPTKLLKPRDLLADLSTTSAFSGLYCWWFDASLPKAPRLGCIEIDGLHLLYVGIAPRDEVGLLKASKSPLVSRVWKNHIRGRIRSSTLRYSIAALLDEEFRFRVNRDKRNKPSMSQGDEERLSRWMHQHALVSVYECRAPWKIEEKIVKYGPPLPLNIGMSAHPFAKELKVYRQKLGRQ